MKLISVVVPCYNSQDYMEKCIESLHPWDDRVEILVVNDGSSDNTGRIADEYAAKYPGNVRALHQPNGGHGEGINHGLREATGTFFKTVDSDDVLADSFSEFLDLLEAHQDASDVDLFLTDYRYVHADGVGDKTINFSNALPKNRIFGWSDVGHFRPTQILMIHTCTFRTAVLRERGIVLPKKTFYEDNYYIYANLTSVKSLYYMHDPMYLYTIGREGQSVQRDVMMKRYTHQLTATELCFKACHLNQVENRRLRKYLRHELLIMLGIAVTYTRLNNTYESETNYKTMWERCISFDSKQANYFRNHTALWFLCLPGRLGVRIVKMIYAITHMLIRFN